MQSLTELVKRRDVGAIKAHMAEHNLVVRDGKIVPRDDDVKDALRKQADFWTQRQQAR